VNKKERIIRARLPWTSKQIEKALNLVGLPHSAEQVSFATAVGFAICIAAA
jgi:hypothetical protein